MKTNIITFVGTFGILFALVIGFATVRPVLAQVAATSTDSTMDSTTPVNTVAASTPTDASSSPPMDNVSSSTAPVHTAPVVATTATMTNAAATGADASVQKTPTEPPPAGFTEVHIIGTKYIDYFTDGSTTITVPGDQNIDGNLD